MTVPVRKDYRKQDGSAGHSSKTNIQRRRVIRAAAAVGLASSLGPYINAHAAKRTLKILQWNHFVPGYDKWFDNTYTKQCDQLHVRQGGYRQRNAGERGGAGGIRLQAGFFEVARERHGMTHGMTRQS